MVVCSLCGTAPPAAHDEPDGDESEAPADIPMTWVMSVENGQVRFYCDQCSRDHVRSIESKLDSEWW